MWFSWVHKKQFNSKIQQLHYPWAVEPGFIAEAALKIEEPEYLDQKDTAGKDTIVQGVSKGSCRKPS